jgi:hypothetical protein
VDNQNFWNLQAWRERLNPQDLLDKLFFLHHNARYEKIGIEKTMYSQVIQPFLEEEMRKRNTFLPIVELHHNQKKKEERMEEKSKYEADMCRECGDRPAETRKDGTFKNGLCGVCNGKKISAAFAKKKARQRQMDQTVKGIEVRVEDERQKGLEEAMERLKEKAHKKLHPVTLTLNFTDYPELLDTLAQGAKYDFRSVEMQALWIIKESYTDATA